MKLKLKNFAKIHEAELEFNGLTVIAGNNNTGKSTIGKVLFSLFDALQHVDARIEEERNRLLQRTIEEGVRELLSGKDSDRKVMLMLMASADFTEYIKHGGNPLTWDMQNVFTLLQKYNIHLSKEEYNGFERNMQQKMQEVLAVNHISYKKSVLKQSFATVFHSQINSLLYPDSQAEVKLWLKGKPIALTFSQNDCIDVKQEIDVMSNITYIDNPFVIDQIVLGLDSQMVRLYDKASKTVMDRKLLRSISQSSSQIFQSIIAKEKLNTVLNRMKEVIAGQTTVQGEQLSLKEDVLSKPIKIENLSTGLKAFMVLKLLLENNALKEKDLLVLDEPEVHLHPEWQILYAEIVVLLQKTFHLTVLLTTHSPYFLHAVEVYSKKYGIEDQCKYYLAENQNHEAYFRDVTGETDTVYQMMLKPFEDLQKLLYED